MHRPYTTKNNKSKRMSDKMLYFLPCVAVLILAGLVVAKLTINNNKDASAYTAPSATATTYSVLSDLSLGVTINSINSPAITPTAAGVVQDGTVNFTVNTSNTFGYSLAMYTLDPSTSAATTNLTNAGANATIGTVSTTYSAADFASSDATMNKWAYKNSSGNYVPVTTSTTLTPQTNAGSYQDSVTFGTKINNSIPNGLYSVTLNFVVTATKPTSSDDRSGFEQAFAYAGVDPYENGYYALQDMTTDICNMVYAPKSKTDSKVKSIQLIDKRDKKTYWVSKVAQSTAANGGGTVTSNCWMTQNLDLDLSGSVALNSTTSDIDPANFGTSGIYTAAAGYSADGTTWTPVRGTITTIASGKFSGYTNDYNTPYSADPGNWYWYPKQESSAIYNSETSCAGDFGCNYLSKNGNWAGYFTQTMNGLSGQTNGKHGHVGNYYNWSAAVASNNTSSATTQDTSYGNSICPKNWRLAVGADNNTNDYKLVNNYYNGGSGSDDNGLVSSPLYFVRGGLVDDGTLYHAGRFGLYWSSTVYSSQLARLLSFRTGYVYPAGNDYRSYGRSVRCVAR
ncbi:hypothetical protein IJ118_00605 [Candidatus Saccharibacteria bacterium]|nr:hypothetical protein [Candidatus Saccharibacteria bacterium]